MNTQQLKIVFNYMAQMNKVASNQKIRIDNRLKRIANVLLLNASFINNPGLLNGKTGIAILFFNYARYSGDKIFEDYAGELIDEIYEEINTNTPIEYADGLTGIGWGFEYLVSNGFIEADTDEALEEIDNAVYRSSLYRPSLLNNSSDLFGYGLYFISRLRGHENDDDNRKTLFKKQHLIYLTDDCERILVEKQYSKHGIKSLSIDIINSFLWFLLEVHRLGLFPVKVEKILRSIPEYVDVIIKSSIDKTGKSLLLQLTKNIIRTVTDSEVQEILKSVLENNDIDSNVTVPITEEMMINSFTKNAWQQLVYEPYVIPDKQLYSLEKILSIIENDENWNHRLDTLNKDNMGLTGLAGLALGLLDIVQSHSKGVMKKTPKAVDLNNRTRK